MRGLVTAGPRFRLGGCLALRSGVVGPHRVSGGFPNRTPLPTMRNGCLSDVLGSWLDDGWGSLSGSRMGGMGDCPDKADHLAGDRGGDDLLGLALGEQRPVARAQA